MNHRITDLQVKAKLQNFQKYIKDKKKFHCPI